jgi:hypothetical protein
LFIPAEVVGTIEGVRAVGIITDYVARFFDQHLKDQGSELLADSPTTYPEVVFESH